MSFGEAGFAAWTTAEPQAAQEEQLVVIPDCHPGLLYLAG